MREGVIHMQYSQFDSTNNEQVTVKISWSLQGAGI